MLKAVVTLNRKITRDYNSIGYGVSVEGEIPATPDDHDGVLGRIKELFGLAEEALAQEIDRDQSEDAIGQRDEVRPSPAPAPTNNHGNGTPAPTTAVHEALATYHRSIQAGKPCDRETVLGTFLKTWIEREARDLIRYAAGDNRDEILEQGGTLIGVYLQEPPPQNIVAVEETFMSPIVTSDGEVLDKPLMSIIDLLVREPLGRTITDFKTAGRSMSAAEADMSLQATAYSNAVKHNFDESASFRFLVLVKTKTPKVQHVEAIRTESDLGRFGDLVRSVERAIAAEAFYPIETPLNCAGNRAENGRRNHRRPLPHGDGIGLRECSQVRRAAKSGAANRNNRRQTAANHHTRLC